MKRLPYTLASIIALISVISCKNSPQPEPEMLSLNDNRLVVGPDKYTLLLSSRFGSFPNIQWVCAVEPNPEIDDVDAILSNVHILDQIQPLVDGGYVASVIHGLEPSTKYYCRAYSNATGYGREYTFETGPDIGRRLTYFTENDPLEEEVVKEHYYYDKEGRLSVRTLELERPVDFRFGSQNLSFVTLFSYEENIVTTTTVRLDPSNQWSANYPEDYQETGRYTYEQNRLISYETVNSSVFDQYYRMDDKVIKVENRSSRRDSIVTELHLEEAYSLESSYHFSNGQYELSFTRRLEYDLAKRDPNYDMQNMQQGYGNSPLLIGYTKQINGVDNRVVFDYQFDGLWPISFGNSEYRYTSFE